ncbi:hypothetical protein J6590_011971 [Homalodisca vitripennis]|nr:hypothetical protein J6590_011971 [Homalodisca vitripennis]
MTATSASIVPNYGALERLEAGNGQAVGRTEIPSYWRCHAQDGSENAQQSRAMGGNYDLSNTIIQSIKGLIEILQSRSEPLRPRLISGSRSRTSSGAAGHHRTTCPTD